MYLHITLRVLHANVIIGYSYRMLVSTLHIHHLHIHSKFELFDEHVYIRVYTHLYVLHGYTAGQAGRALLLFYTA